MSYKKYLNNGQKVIFKDSTFSRDINAVLKEGTVIIDENKLFVNRNGNSYLVPCAKDDVGFYLDDEENDFGFDFCG